MRSFCAVAASCAFFFACPPAPSTGEGEGEEGEGEEGEGEVVFEDIDGRVELDVDGRAAVLKVPFDYDPAEEHAFILLLHGYGFSGPQMESITSFQGLADELGFVFASPSGTVDQDGNNFWNASSACCDFRSSDVDDSAFLRGVIDQALAIANIDPDRVYVVGHSNGGFMAHRMACDHSDVVTGIVSLAGAIDAAVCEPDESVPVLQVHGTADDTIRYTGGSVGMAAYPSAQATVDQWALLNSCGDGAVAPDRLDLDRSQAGAETEVFSFSACSSAVELWSVEGAGHVIDAPDGLPVMLQWLEDHR